MKQNELSFSRDGGKTWEVVGFVGEITDLGLFQTEPEPQEGRVILVGSSSLSVSGVLTIKEFPRHFEYDRGAPGPDRSQPWLRPKKGRGRQL